MKIKKTKSRIKLGISCAVALVCLVGVGYSGVKIVEWLIDSLSTKQQTAAIDEAAGLREVDDGDGTEIIPSDDDSDLYHRFLKMKLLDINFADLRAMNSETAGWIAVSGTDINYPFV